jgi:hypothetical protein
MINIISFWSHNNNKNIRCLVCDPQHGSVQSDAKKGNNVQQKCPNGKLPGEANIMVHHEHLRCETTKRFCIKIKKKIKFTIVASSVLLALLLLAPFAASFSKANTIRISVVIVVVSFGAIDGSIVVDEEANAIDFYYKNVMLKYQHISLFKIFCLKTTLRKISIVIDLKKCHLKRCHF